MMNEKRRYRIFLVCQKCCVSLAVLLR